MEIAETKREFLLLPRVEMPISLKVGVHLSSVNGSSIITPVGWFRKGSYLSTSNMWQVHAFIFLNYNKFGLPLHNYNKLSALISGVCARYTWHLECLICTLKLEYSQVYVFVAQKWCLAEWCVDECCQLFGFTAVILAWYSLWSRIDHREQPDLSYLFVTVDAIFTVMCEAFPLRYLLNLMDDGILYIYIAEFWTLLCSLHLLLSNWAPL